MSTEQNKNNETSTPKTQLDKNLDRDKPVEEITLNQGSPNDVLKQREAVSTEAPKPAAKPAETKAEAPKPAAKPAETKAEVPKPAAKPAETKAEVPKPAAKPAETKAEAPKPAAKPAETKAEVPKPTAKPAETKAEAPKPAAKPAETKAEVPKPAVKPAETKAEVPKPAAKPAEIKAEVPKPAAKPKTTKNINGNSKNTRNWLPKVFSFLIFLFLVIIPWLVVINYVINIAHPRYISTSGVVVKQVSEANVSTGTGISAILGVNNTSVEDAKYLTEYIMSNDMVKKLDKQFHFQQHYYRDGTDIIYELDKNATQEELLEYFKQRVHISLDEQTYVLTVTTEGFEAEYALELNKAILRESEQFVNRISNQIATDQLGYAQAQLADSQDKLNQAKERLLNYQNQKQIFDPQINAQMISQLVGNLQAQLSNLRTEERQLLSYLNPEAPQIVSIRSQINSVEKQIRLEQGKLTSPNTEKLNRQTIQFESIKADVEFATEMYKISLSSLEKARLEAYKKMKNLIVISTPYQAEEALYPRVHYIIWTSLAFLLIFYGFIRLIIAVIKDHSG